MMCCSIFKCGNSSTTCNFTNKRITFHREIMTMAVAEAPWLVEFEKLEPRLRSGHWSDCTFEVGSETNKVVVPAHKVILAMASPVFETMFYGGLTDDTNEPMIPLPDVQPEVFRALLKYIYTGRTDINSFYMARELWLEAKKYMLPHLEKKCKSYICSVVGPRNACQVYELASLMEEKTLMDLCIQIITANTKDVLSDRSFVDVEFDTVLTLLSLEHLNVDSELDLFQAVAKYYEAQKMQCQSMGSDADGPFAEELSESVEPTPSEDKASLMQNVESSPQNSPAVELDSKNAESVEPTPSEDKASSVQNVESSPQNSPAVELDSKNATEKVVTSEPTTDNENSEEGEAIQEAIKKIRFLSLTAAQFADGPARSDLLTKDQKYAVLMNISIGASAVPMPSGFSECWERRQQRNVVNEPSTQSRGVAATKLPTPAQIIKDLASCDPDTLKAAARAARITTADDTPEKLAQLVGAGVIPLLVAVLDQSGSGVQYDAAWALTNISQEHAHTNAVVDGGAVPKLVGLLDNGGHLAEQAALALGHIAQSKRLALERGAALPALISHMTPSTPSTQLVTYLWTYGIICEHEPEIKMVSPALPYIKNLLALANEQVLVEVCSVLFYLTSGQHQQFDPKLFTPDLTARLTDLLGHAAPRVQAAALKALENMMANNELKDQCLGGFLDHITDLLKSGNPSHVEDATRAIADILGGTPVHIQQALDKRILDPLGIVLTEGHARCKVQAVVAVSALCSKGSAPQLRELVYGAALEPYCRLLGDTENCFDVLRGLTNLLQNIEQNARDTLCLKLLEFDVPGLLIPLQEHEDQLVCERANHLKTYFGERWPKGGAVAPGATRQEAPKCERQVWQRIHQAC